MMRKVVSLVMCLLLPGLLLAGNPGAGIGNFVGDVALNGRSVPPSTAVFPGDKLVTGRNASAYITRPGFTMAVDSESSAQLLAEGARVLSGSSVVTLKPGNVVEYDDLHISAASDSARVRIVSRPGSQMIASLQGTLKVSDTSGMITVPQGHALLAKPLDPPPNLGDQPDKSSPPAGAIKKGVALKKWVMIFGSAGAAGGVGAWAAVQSSNKNTNINNINSSISPSAP